MGKRYLMPFSFKILRVALLILYLDKKGNGIWQFTVVREGKTGKKATQAY